MLAVGDHLDLKLARARGRIALAGMRSSARTPGTSGSWDSHGPSSGAGGASAAREALMLRETVELLKTLVTQSLLEMPEGGDLTVTACETPTGIELELADTGCDVSDREKRFPMAAAAIGAAVIWQNCPQGGGAVTIKFRPQEGVRRAAA